jgi:ribosomal protein S18 acetylase RimI-like enzyme
MMSFVIRIATAADADSIAMIHAASWKSTYRGILSDAYLDNDLEAERQGYWRDKIAKLTDKEFVILAAYDGVPAGFIAVMDKPEAGCDAFIDNLHVRGDLKGQGIGGKLMRAAAERLLASGRKSVYLWVLKGNHAAEAFYKAKGAVTEDTSTVDFGGTKVLQTRFVWKTLDALLGK